MFDNQHLISGEPKALIKQKIIVCQGQQKSDDVGFFIGTKDDLCF